MATFTVDTDVLASTESFACVETSACCVRGYNTSEEGVGDVVIHAELITIDMYLRCRLSAHEYHGLMVY